MHARDRLIASAFLLFVTGVGVAWSQGADFLTSVSAEPALTVGDAAALVGIVAGSLASQTEPSVAVEQLSQIGIALPRRSVDSPITLGEYSYLLMQLLDIPGGFLYSVFPGPYFAVRELQARGLVAEGAHQGQHLPGVEGLRILGMLVRGQE